MVVAHSLNPPPHSTPPHPPPRTLQLESTHEASAALMDAGNCYKKSSPPSAISAFRAAVSNWCEAGRFNQAAKLTKEIAEMYEKDNEVVEAIDNYSQAATFFDTENSKSQGNTCKVRGGREGRRQTDQSLFSLWQLDIYDISLTPPHPHQPPTLPPGQGRRALLRSPRTSRLRPRRRHLRDPRP